MCLVEFVFLIHSLPNQINEVFASTFSFKSIKHFLLILKYVLWNLFECRKRNSNVVISAHIYAGSSLSRSSKIF